MALLGASVANSIGDALFTQVNWTAPTALWMSMHTATPGSTGASEVSGSSYARVNVTTSFSSVDGVITNTAQIDFPEVTSSSYTATHIGFWSASTAGTYYVGADVSPDKLHAVGAIPSFAVGEVDFTIS